MVKQNEPRQGDLFDIHPVCRQTGCKQETHFKAIRTLQRLNEHLEKYARHFDSCVATRGDEACTCGFEDKL